MAKIVEEVLVVKVSQLTKEGLKPDSKLTPEVVEGLEAVVTELVGDGCVVEILTEE